MKHFSFVFVLSLFCISLSAQDINVKSFRQLPNDLDARTNYTKRDQNGDVCAIIKVITTEPGFSFDVGQLGVVATEQKIGEIWVYVPHGVQRITIKHGQLGILRAYALGMPIEQATVYELVLTTARVTTVVEEEKILTQWFAMDSEPKGANVFIGEKLVGTTPYTGQFPEGDYAYRIELPRYHPEAGKITLKGKRETLTFKMRPRFGNVSVTSNPENGMMIYLNDENTGKTTPATLEGVSSGNQTVKLMDRWYQPQAKMVTVSDNQTTTVSFTMEPAFASITVKTNPPADILINGTKTATGSYTDRMLTGIYTLKAQRDRYHPEERQLIVEAGKAQNISLDLRPITGRLDITSTPFEAKIKLNGKDYGTTPTTVSDLLIGTYTLTLEKQGYATVTKTITIAQGKTTEISETLPSGMEVTIASTPSGAQLWLDGVSVGTTGWHLPSDAEWKQLEMFLGITQKQADETGWRGTDQGKKLKAKKRWRLNGNGIDEHGFSALPGGYNSYFGISYTIGRYGYWWSATEYSTYSAWSRQIYCYFSYINRNDSSKDLGFSVRCVKD